MVPLAHCSFISPLPVITSISSSDASAFNSRPVNHVPCNQTSAFNTSSSTTPACRRASSILESFIRGKKVPKHRSNCHERRWHTSAWRGGAVASIEICDPDDFEVGKLLGTYGYMNVTSYAPSQPGGLLGDLYGNAPAGYDMRDVERLRGQEVGEGGVQTRLYAGRIARGRRTGTRVILKAYPGRTTGGADADAMAANELATHAILQDVLEAEVCPNLVLLLGGFQTRTGEQWLVFRDDGQITAADYARIASKASTEGRAVGEWEFLDNFDRGRPIKRRRVFIIKLLRGLFSGLAYMHSKGRLHQSLGPASVVINIMEERDVYFLQPQLRDLGFAVDVSDQVIFGGSLWRRWGTGTSSEEAPVESATAALAEGLWRRAASAGAMQPLEQKAFGIADDIYAAGLLFAYMVFIPFCETGSIDGPSLQRLLESTFRLDVQAAREYCLADDRWVEAVNFLDLDDGSGWELLQAMLNPDYRQRPIASAILNHRFMTGAVL